MKTFIAVIATAVVSFAVPSVAHTQHNKPDIPIWVTRPCKSEGDVNCRWNAQTQGNGQGHTYIVREVPGSTHMVCVFYAERKFARTHDYCS